MTKLNPQRGNILFLILLAVILFAALSYAVTSSLRGGGKDGSDEKYEAMAAQLIQYGTMLENTIMRSRLANSIPDWGWDFWDDTGPTVSGANNTCTQTACRVFTTSGRQGLMESVSFSNDFLDPRAGLTGNAVLRIVSVNVLGVGTSAPDLALIVASIRPEICKAINKAMTGIYDNVHEGRSYLDYSNTMTSFPDPGGGGAVNDQAPYLYGMPTGCAGRELASPSVGGEFYHVLIAR